MPDEAAATDVALNGKLEAILFAAGRPMTPRQLATLVGAKLKEVEAAVTALDSGYEQAQRGLRILQQDGKVQLVSNPTYGKAVEDFVKEEFTGPLSRAALETLAIIAYRGPIPKPAIDTIRGVNSGIMLRTLLIRGLVERKRSRSDARTYEYSPSTDFMRHLGVTKLAELPRYAELHANEVIERLAQSAAGASMQPEEQP